MGALGGVGIRGAGRAPGGRSALTGRSRLPTGGPSSGRAPEVAQELPSTSPVEDFRQPFHSSRGNLETLSKRAPAKGRAGKSRRAEQDHYDTDYTTGGESCDELEDDWVRYPSVPRWNPLHSPMVLVVVPPCRGWVG